MIELFIVILFTAAFIDQADILPPVDAELKKASPCLWVAPNKCRCKASGKTVQLQKGADYSELAQSCERH